MSNRLQNRWIFSWNADELDNLSVSNILRKKLNSIVAKSVFQLEVGEKNQRKHHQGRFKLKGLRINKLKLLKEFGEIFDTRDLTFEPELSYDSTGYCTKVQTRVEGPWYVGLQSYISESRPMDLILKRWQSQLLELIQGPLQSYLRDRKVICIQCWWSR